MLLTISQRLLQPGQVPFEIVNGWSAADQQLIEITESLMEAAQYAACFGSFCVVLQILVRLTFNTR